MNTLLLQPTDTLFFRDGRPMSGSLIGHGAAWPLPTVVNAALHAALHRADFDKTELGKVHSHRRGRSGIYQEERDRKFGSLVSAGPFPVSPKNLWFYPRPADAQEPGTTSITLKPASILGSSNLPPPLINSVGSSQPPSKEKPEPWWSQKAWDAYLKGTTFTRSARGEDEDMDFKTDSNISDTEHSIGIGISPETGTQNCEQFYSANSLRLRPEWRLGVVAEALDKVNGDTNNKRDLIQTLFPNSGQETPVIVGGQQRLCTALRNNPAYLPLPVAPQVHGTRVKWILLSPAVFPLIEAGISKRGTERKAHPGGWLPTWICPDTGEVLLETVSEEERRRRRNLNASGKGYSSNPNIPAKLIAAIVPKPMPVTGYALPNTADPDRQEGGAKSTHLAVPAGAVYYFKCDTPEAAQSLASALNWHGSDINPNTIRNRRSTLMGEKGFGLGVCGTWNFQPPTEP
jgi:CRISPR-associated protein Cmr3